MLYYLRTILSQPVVEVLPVEHLLAFPKEKKGAIVEGWRKDI